MTLTNTYGLSKYAGELAAVRVPGTVLRTNFFGRSACEGRASLSDWLVCSLKSGQAITVFEDVFFSPLRLQRLAEEIARIVAFPRTGVFNLGSREGMSKADFAFALGEVLRLPTATMRRGTSDDGRWLAYRPRDMRMDTKRFEETFAVRMPTLREEIDAVRGSYDPAT